MMIFISTITLIVSLLLPTTDAKDGYFISFYLPQTTTLNCTVQYNRIHDKVYKLYIEELIDDTDLTYADIDKLDPDWYVRRRQLQSQGQRGIVQSQSVANEHPVRRLQSLCSKSSCSKGDFFIAVNGCTGRCPKGRRLSGSSKFDKSRLYGSRTNPAKESKGKDVVEAFWKNVDTINSTDPCRKVLNSLFYQLDLFRIN